MHSSTITEESAAEESFSRKEEKQEEKQEEKKEKKRLDKEKQGNNISMTGFPLCPPRAVLFDRDGTLVVDVPYNGDPDLVVPMPTAAEAVLVLRASGLKVGVVTNQSGIARGTITRQQADRVNERINRELGPFDVWEVCPHGPEDGCSCRKPKPGMVLRAARRLCISPAQIAVIGDIGADVAAAEAAGARGILVPTPVTRRTEVRAAREVADTVLDAVLAVLEGRNAVSTRTVMVR